MTIVGYVLLVIATVWLLYKLFVAFNSAGGTSMMVPVYDAAIYPPPMAAFGLYWVLGSFGIQLSIWVYVGIWLAIAAVAAGLIKLMEELGDRPL